MHSSDQDIAAMENDRTSLAVIHLTLLQPHDDNAIVFIAQRTTGHSEAFGIDRSTHDGQIRDTIRAQSANLFSKDCLGLAVSAAVSGFCGALFATVFKPLFISGYLTTTHAELASTASTLLQWPPVLSIFIGLASDGALPSGLNRKSGIVLGWLQIVAALAAAAAITYVSDLTSRSVATALVALCIIAAVGFQVVSIVSLAITVDYSQQEPTDTRGHFQGSYFLVFYSITALTQLMLTHFLIETTHAGAVVSAISLQQTLVLLAGCSLLPLPFIYWCLQELHNVCMSSRTSRERAKSTASSTLTTGISTYLQQKPVYRIYFFLFGIVFLVNAKSSDVSRALVMWSGISPDKSGNVLVAQAMPKVIAVILWKFFMINLNWRILGVCGLALYALCSLVLTLACGLGAWRDEWTYYAWTAVAAIPLGWFEVFLVILPTEVAGIGHEGLALGLVSTCVALITITSSTLWDSINRAAGFAISDAEIQADAPSTRHKVVAVGVIYALVNLASVVLAPLLPLQKLEAQQWRVFGGSSRPAAHSLACVFALLLLYNLFANWLAKTLGW